MKQVINDLNVPKQGFGNQNVSQLATAGNASPVRGMQISTGPAISQHQIQSQTASIEKNMRQLNSFIRDSRVGFGTYKPNKLTKQSNYYEL